MPNTTKGNLTEIPVKHYIITATDIARYLGDQLGVRFDCDFTLLDNRGPWEKPLNFQKCYVLMRAIFATEDICVPTDTTNYADRFLSENSANMQFRKEFIETLRPFMFPENMAQVRLMPAEQARLAEMGLKGRDLEDLMRRPGLFYDTINKKWGVYLRPERIIADMAKDPATNTVRGVLSHVYLDGNPQQPESIKWGINIYNGSTSVTSYGVTVDDVFGTNRK